MGKEYSRSTQIIDHLQSQICTTVRAQIDVFLRLGGKKPLWGSLGTAAPDEIHFSGDNRCTRCFSVKPASGMEESLHDLDLG